MENNTISIQKETSEWEAHWKEAPLASYVKTLQEVILHPVAYFGLIKPMQDYLGLIVFIYINGMLVVLGSFGIQITVDLLFQKPESLLISIPGFVCAIIFAPVAVVGFSFFGAAILHFCLKIIGGTTKNFDTTITVYGLGTSKAVFGIVPILGTIVGMIYAVLINIGGQAKAHEISVTRAALAFLFPACLCCCFLFFIVFFLGLIGLNFSGS